MTELPKFIAHAGVVSANFRLDYGSFRDVQRHRAIQQRMPLLTQDLGFNEWYVQNLPPQVQKELPEHLERVSQGIEDLNVQPTMAQYFTPMGYNTSNRFIGDLPSAIYMVELRASPSVHPTLQKVAYNIGTQISTSLDIPVHITNEGGRFDLKRGDHDIEMK